MKSTPIQNLFFQIGFALILSVGIVPNAAVAASPPKVQVCHFPPGNPDNFHTINISENALPAHLAHGDLIGPCDASCGVICNDGNACTVDDTGDCEANGCPTEPAPVDCSDSNLCTTDTCDPATGCINKEVTCEAPDKCTASACSPETGACVDTPIVCPEGEVCNPDTGVCESSPDPECAGQTCATFTTCNEGGSCGTSGVCGSTSEGGGLCVDGDTPCPGLTACPGGTPDCTASPGGGVCIVESCCGSPVCVPASQVCSEPAAGATSSEALLLEPTSESTVGKAKE